MQISPIASTFKRHRIIKAHFLWRLEKEVNGDYNVSGTVIPNRLVQEADYISNILTFKSATVVKPDLVIAQNTGEVCVRFHCQVFMEPDIDVLLPASIIEKIEVEESTQNKTFYFDVFKLASGGR